MKTATLLAAICAVAPSLPLAGCGGTDVQTATRTTTTGQELLNLQ